MRRTLLLFVVVVATLFASTSTAVAKTDKVKNACVNFTVSYSTARNGSPVGPPVANYEGFKNTSSKTLLRLVNAVATDDRNQSALDELAGWCEKHYAKVKALRNIEVVARTTTTTTTLPPTTTTLGPAPQHYEGANDSVVDVVPVVTQPAVVHVVGNDASRYFGVTSY